MSNLQNSLTEKTDDWQKQVDEFARREPGRAVATAFGLGVLINFLPLRLIFSAVVGIFLLLLRPALLFLGLLKLTELARSESKKKNA